MLQNVRLYSVDGTVFIEILADGTFALFATETGSVIYEFLAPTRDVNTPLALTMQTVRSALQRVQPSSLWPDTIAALPASSAAHRSAQAGARQFPADAWHPSCRVACCGLARRPAGSLHTPEHP